MPPRGLTRLTACGRRALAGMASGWFGAWTVPPTNVGTAEVIGTGNFLHNLLPWDPAEWHGRSLAAADSVTFIVLPRAKRSTARPPPEAAFPLRSSLPGRIRPVPSRTRA